MLLPMPILSRRNCHLGNDDGVRPRVSRRPPPRVAAGTCVGHADFRHMINAFTIDNKYVSMASTNEGALSTKSWIKFIEKCSTCHFVSF